MSVRPPSRSRRTRGGLTDAGAVALAVATAAGAWCSWPVPIGLGLLVAVLALVRRRPVALVVGSALLASGLGARAWAGLVPPPQERFAGQVTLLGDPRSSFGGLRVDVGLDGRRLELQARGPEAAALADRLTGERVEVHGRLGPVPDVVRERLARRHVAGRLTVDEVGAWQAGSPAHRLANGLRRTLTTGAAPLGDDRALFTGMVVGDDRAQPAVVAGDFRAAGLTHLLAVSGQSVTYALCCQA